MKRWMFGCVLVVALCWAVGALAAEVPVEGGSLRIVNGFVEGYDGAPAHVVIPGEADGVPVMEIAANAFGSCESLVSVQIPDTVVQIGECAFYNCTTLESVQMPRRPVVYDETGVVKEAGYDLGVRAFAGCIALKSIDLTGVTWIAHDTFFSCDSLTKVTLDPALWGIDVSAFGDCISLERLDIPAGVSYIGSSAFYYTPFDQSLTDDIVILGKVLYRCNRRVSGRLEIPEHVVSVSSLAAQHNREITELICGDNLESIGTHAFSGCDNLRKITFGKGLTKIERMAFSGCRSLQNVVLPAYMEKIGYGAFQNCTSLQSVTFLSVVDEVLGAAFVDCPNLRAVYIGDDILGVEFGAWQFDPRFEDHTVIYYDYPDDGCWGGYTVRPQPKLMPCGYAFLQDGVETDGFPTAAGRYQLRATLCPSHEKSADSLFPMTAFAAFYQDDHLLHIQSFALTADDWQSLGTDRVDVGELALPVTVPEGANRARLLLWSSGGLQPLTVDGWIQ